MLNRFLRLLRYLSPTARVTPGAHWGLGRDTCLAAMTTWRASWMDDARWQRTCTAHELEVLLFKAQIEADWQRRAA